jgi:hypothetical protein
MKFNLEQLMYEHLLENEDEDQNNYLIEASANFETFLDDLDLEACLKSKLSDLKTDYGSQCKKQGFHYGYCTALEIIKQLIG